MAGTEGGFFPDSVKLDAKKLAAFRCCMCHTRAGDEVHHIVPPAEGGTNDLDNAVLLCAQCHNDNGSRPERRKFIREARDFWYERVRTAYKPENISMLVQLDNLATKADLDGMQAQMQTMLPNMFSSVRQGSTSTAEVVNVASTMISSLTVPTAFHAPNLLPLCGECGAGAARDVRACRRDAIPALGTRLWRVREKANGDTHDRARATARRDGDGR